MYDSNAIVKYYFIFVNVVGYFIVFLSGYQFYNVSGVHDVRWMISALIGCFIVIFKNSKVIEKGFRSLYYYLDTISVLLILLVVRNVPANFDTYKLVGVSLFLFCYLIIYTLFIGNDKIHFIGQDVNE